MVYQLPAQTYFYQKDIIDHGGSPHQLADIPPMNTIVYLHIYLPYIYHVSNQWNFHRKYEQISWHDPNFWEITRMFWVTFMDFKILRVTFNDLT